MSSPYTSAVMSQFGKIGRPLESKSVTENTYDEPFDLGGLMEMIWMLMNMKQGETGSDPFNLTGPKMGNPLAGALMNQNNLAGSLGGQGTGGFDVASLLGMLG